MSRIGKKVIKIPSDVTVDLKEEKVIIKGKHGTLEKNLLEGIQVEIKETQLTVLRTSESKKIRSYHGLIRALIQNMITGVNEKFSKTLIAEGVGYRFQIDKKELILNMGYSHPIRLIIPEGLIVEIESPTKILVKGIEKEKVGFFASQIRNVRPPEPYKGKGIRYDGEVILRKAGKTGK